MICGIFSRITFKIGDIRRKYSKHSRPIGIMEKGIVDELAKIRETQTSYKRKQWSRIDHIGGGFACGVTLVST